MSFPNFVGFAIDPTTSPKIPKNLYTGLFPGNSHYLLHLCDPLLLYDTVMIRSDYWTLKFLYSNFACEELEPLLNAERIKFFAVMCETSSAWPCLNVSIGSTSKDYLKCLHDSFLAISQNTKSHSYLRSDANKIVNQIEKYSVTKQAINIESCKILKNRLRDSFFEAFGDNISYYHEKGFLDGIGMILDIWSTGTLALHLDSELEFYFSKVVKVPEKIKNNLFSSGMTIIDEFNSIGNLPSLKEAILLEKLDSKDIFNIILSDESFKLREWIKKNYSPNLDVRDCYFKTLQKLPSKSSWLNWLRFGTTSTLSISLGFILSSSPALAALLGLSIGAADLAFGTQTTKKLFDSYHPKEWIGFIETKYQNSNN